jgi:hypothetical protein
VRSLGAWRAVLAGAIVVGVLAVSASAASAVTIAPDGSIDAQGTTLQRMWVQSLDYTYTCRWRMQGGITQRSISLGMALVQLGFIHSATIGCNELGVTVTPLVSTASTWPIGLIPIGGVLGLPTPTGMLVTVLAVRFRIDDTVNNFHCLFTGRLGLLIRNGANPQIQLLTSQFFATPSSGDNCPVNLILYKFNGQYNLFPPQFIGP